MRALSIRQPWAEMIMKGQKTTEYRSINTNIRGRVYIYASLKLDGYANPDRYNVVGKIIGSVEIVDSKWRNGQYHWKLRNPRRLSKPFAPKRHPQPVFFNPF